MPDPIDLLCQTFQLRPQQISPPQLLQSLWSGYGQINRYRINTDNRTGLPASVIAKQIQPPDQRNHPRGWNTSRSHERKLRSYEVETHWYAQWTSAAGLPRMAQCYAQQRDGSAHLLLLEDLDAAGFPVRRQSLAPEACTPCLHWLAQLHGRFLRCRPDPGWQQQLWPSGTYWHLQTRPDEWQRMADGPLKALAPAIDKALNHSDYTTLVHGDAKVANFCFSEDGRAVAAVDFQYIGAGCGMKDVAYFLGSCLSAGECAQHSSALLDIYFAQLRQQINANSLKLNFNKLEQEWRNLFPLAWADFERFLLGWEPRHHKLTRFSHEMTQQALNTLQPR